MAFLLRMPISSFRTKQILPGLNWKKSVSNLIWGEEIKSRTFESLVLPSRNKEKKNFKDPGRVTSRLSGSRLKIGLGYRLRQA